MIKNYINHWQDVKDSAMTTINKLAGKHPDSNWKTNILISEHSPIRLIKINYIFLGIKSWISVHFSRHHVGVTHFISTQRDDRTEIDRNNSPQSTPVNHRMDINAQAIIDMSRKRLCYMAHTETIRKMKDFLIDLREYEPEIESVCIPNCIYRNGCPEFQPCKQNVWNNFYNKYLKDKGNISIKERYAIYKNSEFGKLN